MLLTTLAVAWTAAPAQAQWVVTPYLGANVAGDVETGKGGPGAAIGYFGEWLGLEFDFTRYQHFFKDAEIFPLDPAAPPNCMESVGPCTDIDTRAAGFVGNVVVPIRIPRATKWRPYGTAGFGVIRAWANGDRESRHQNSPAFNVGAGVRYSLSKRVGLRGDLRYSRALVDQDTRAGVFFRDYGFWRTAIGVTFGFPR